MRLHSPPGGPGKSGVTVYPGAAAPVRDRAGPRLLPTVIDERLCQNTRLEQIDSVCGLVMPSITWLAPRSSFVRGCRSCAVARTPGLSWRQRVRGGQANVLGQQLDRQGW